MNNRDPFNLRRNQPLNFLRPAPDPSTKPPNTLQVQLQQLSEEVESKEPALQVIEESVDDGMSYAFPQSSSTLNADTHHGTENASWQQRRSRTDNTQIGGASERLTSMFKTKDELPMYKDKPYNYTTSGRRSNWLNPRRLAVLLCGIIALLVWVSGIFSGGDKSKSNGQKSGGMFGYLGDKHAGKVRWGERREKVKDAFKLSWKAYEEHAWGQDEFHPLSKRGEQMVPNGMGWIIVDALDTMILMNLTSELSHAREWISKTLTYDQDHDVNTFETTIRMLGGLLSAHYLSNTFPSMAPLGVVHDSAGDDLYLEKATDLADRLLGAYESQSGVPFASVNLHTGKGIKSHTDGGASSTAEAASLQLEMKYLAKLTGETHYWEAAEKVIQVIDDNGVQDGLVPIFIHADEGTFRGESIRLGSRGDSFYEYLIKQYLQTSEQEPVYLDMWDESLRGVRKHLLTYSHNANLTILAERPSGLDHPLLPKMDHLVCFMPGTIALGATEGLTLVMARKRPTWGKKQEDDMKLARDLMQTCWGMYKVTATGLSPEIAHFRTSEPPVMVSNEPRESPESLSDDPNAEWRKDFDIHVQDFHNLQRPETVESLFYMWRITGEDKYREWGWEMFESFIQHTAVPDDGGFTSLGNVDQIPPPQRDNMESFWLAETLKYFYLLFGPNDILPLDQIVLNTEAHPFPRFALGKLFSTGWKRKPRDADGKIVREEAPRAAEKPTIEIIALADKAG